MDSPPQEPSDSPFPPPSLATHAIVDAHVHLFPERVLAAIWRWFDSYAWSVRYRLHARECARFLLDRGVAGLVALPYSHVPGMARALNQFVADLAREEPRIAACATVLPGEEGARAILDESLGTLRLRGVKIHCHVQCVAPDDPRLDDVYDAAAAHAVPVVIHAGDEPASPHYRCDVRALCSPGALDRALARHPRTVVIVPHLGAGHVDAVAALLDRHPHLYLDTTMVLAGYFPTDASLRRTEPAAAAALLDRARALLGAWPGRILYGTDFPNIPYRWDRELRALAGFDLGEDCLEAILGGTARRLFFGGGTTGS